MSKYSPEPSVSPFDKRIIFKPWMWRLAKVLAAMGALSFGILRPNWFIGTLAALFVAVFAGFIIFLLGKYVIKGEI